MPNRLKRKDYVKKLKMLESPEHVKTLDFELSKGNLKLPKSTAIFNLTAIDTCLNCKDCKHHCYALNAQNRYPVAEYSRKKHHAISKTKNFISKFNKALKRARVTLVRYHESGDIYSKGYLTKLMKIAKSNPSIYFYTYTKSTMLNFTKLPENFRVIDSTNKAKNLKHKASVLLSKDFANAEHIIKSEYKNFFLCQGDCKKCNYCFNTKIEKIKVLFLEHGVKIKNNKVMQKQINHIRTNFYNWSRKAAK